MSRDPYKRIDTKPLPRAELAPIAITAPPLGNPPAGEDPTLQRCPLCAGCGMVDPDIASAFEDQLRSAQERQG